LYYMRKRMYDSTSGRWLGRDPLTRAAGKDDGLVRVQPLLALVNDWRRFVLTEADEAETHAIRLHGRTARPLGDPAFIARLESRLHRTLRKRPARNPNGPGDKSRVPRTPVSPEPPRTRAWDTGSPSRGGLRMKTPIIILLLPVLGCLLTYYALLRRKALAISTSAGLVAALLETCALGCGIVAVLVYYLSTEVLLLVASLYACAAFSAAPFVIWPGIGWSICARILNRRGFHPEPKPVQGPLRALRIVVRVLCLLGVMFFMAMAMAYVCEWLKDGQ